MKTLLLMCFAALMGYCLMPRVAPTMPVEAIATPATTPSPVTPNWPRRTPQPITPATPKPWGTSLDQGAYNKNHGGPGAAKIIRPKVN